MGFRDLGFRVWGLGFWDLGFRVWGSRFRVPSAQQQPSALTGVADVGCICEVSGFGSPKPRTLNHEL